MQMTDYAGQGSAAYDLDRFHPRQSRRRKPQLTVAKPSLTQAMRARARARMMGTLRVIAGVAAVVGFIVFALYNRVILTELNAKISTANTMLIEELTETTRLSAEVESKLSMRNVEEYATQRLGMAPLDKSQITYVNLCEGDKIELTKASPKATLLDRIVMALSSAKEYIAGN